MKKLASRLHYVFIVWAIFSSFGTYEQFEEKNKQLKQKQTEVMQSISVFEKKRDKAEEYKANIEDLKEKLQIINEGFENTKKRFPANISDSEIRDIANDVKLKKFFFEFKGQEAKDFYVRKDYQLRASGTYLQFLLFFEQIESLNRILNIKSLLLQIKNSNRLDRFQLLEGNANIELYGYNEQFDLDEILEEDNK
ncbi:MAG: type 4a pilus biogenesis protein PilO [Halobacteriovoraceae bacterium]|nr:type 4a pilus biogenesis protein PilO [Halobacteriovoraceae bacterium]